MASIGTARWMCSPEVWPGAPCSIARHRPCCGAISPPASASTCTTRTSASSRPPRGRPVWPPRSGRWPPPSWPPPALRVTARWTIRLCCCWSSSCRGDRASSHGRTFAAGAGADLHGDVDVVVVVRGVRTAVLHPAPALVAALDGPDPLRPDDLADAELGVVGPDPLGNGVALRTARDHDVQGAALAVRAPVARPQPAVGCDVRELRAHRAVYPDGLVRKAFLDLRTGLTRR